MNTGIKLSGRILMVENKEREDRSGKMTEKLRLTASKAHS